MFTLFMILTFEATTAFTRLKNINTLSGMGGKTRSVMVFRRGKWESLSVTDLLPGDVYSLTRESESSETLIPCDSLILRGSLSLNTYPDKHPTTHITSNTYLHIYIYICRKCCC